jgi:hypothetical protein
LPFVLQRSGPSRDLTRTIGRAPSGAVASAGSLLLALPSRLIGGLYQSLNIVRQRLRLGQPLNHGLDRWLHDLAKVGVEGSNPFARSKT